MTALLADIGYMTLSMFFLIYLILYLFHEDYIQPEATSISPL